jgi:hypothetical protein
MATQAHTVPRFYLRGFVDPVSESKPNLDPFLWVGSLASGEIKRKAPRNISIVPSLYDGPEGFSDSAISLEAHLGNIESAAAFAIRKLAASYSGDSTTVPAEVWRFLAWQAARTPGWMGLEEGWANEWLPGSAEDVLEPPPEGFHEISDRARPLCVEDPETGLRREVVNAGEFEAYRKRGWKWVLRRDDHLEMLHLQAWYFQVRHFPRLSWTRLDAPTDEWFITSDRGVAWLADGYADTPPSALRHPTVQVVAPLTRRLALVGRNETSKLEVTPRQINRFMAFATSNWVAGPTKDAVETALADRETLLS